MASSSLAQSPTKDLCTSNVSYAVHSKKVLLDNVK